MIGELNQQNNPPLILHRSKVSSLRTSGNAYSINAISYIKKSLGIARFFIVTHGFVSCFYYYWSYTHFLDYDNIYITYLFETVDAHRRTKKMKYVLPIKSFEKTVYVHPYTILMTRAEKTAIFFSIGMLLYEVSIIYMLIAIMKMHATQLADNAAIHSIQKMSSFLNEGSVEIFDNIIINYNLEFINYFAWIYIMIFLLAIHQVYTTRFRAVICGMVYPQIEESRGVALYHQIIVKRYDLFHIRHMLLLDRLEYEKKVEKKGEFYFRFEWWKVVTRGWYSVKGYVDRTITSKIYLRCTLCWDYGNLLHRLENEEKC